MGKLRLLRPLVFLAVAFAVCLTGCPDDIASTDLAQPKDQGATVQDLAKND